VNVIGDHTDYQLGWVLPCAIGPGVRVTIDLTKTSTVRVWSNLLGTAPDRTLADLAAGPSGWAAYVEGAIAQVLAAQVPLEGVQVTIESDLPVGSGLASSAAVTCATLGALYQAVGVETTPDAIAATAQQVENEYVGAGVGYMDPAAVMFGRAHHALAIDTQARTLEVVPLPIAHHGLELFRVDTQERHRTSGREYRDRVRQCRQAADLLGVASLREVTDPRDLGSIPDPLVRARARHVVSENCRVLEVVALLRAGRVRDIGELMLASHVSLREDFEVSTAALDAVVDTAMRCGALGARVTGAGFGGSALVLADAARAPEITAAIVDDFVRQGRPVPTPSSVQPADGARSLS